MQRCAKSSSLSKPLAERIIYYDDTPPPNSK
jgi:hypothetical protein